MEKRSSLALLWITVPSLRNHKDVSAISFHIVRARRLSSKFLKEGYLVERLKSFSLTVDTGIVFSNMKSPPLEYLMTFWPLTNSDFSTDQTFYLLHDNDTELDLHRIMNGFHKTL